MDIRQFRYTDDNLGYLVTHNRESVAIDGGAVDEMLAYLAARRLRLTHVLNTHNHPDHTLGNKALIDATGARQLDSGQLLASGHLLVGDDVLSVLATPGHTQDSVCFTCGDDLICGDTLFNGTVGNCYSGEMAAFLGSIKRLAGHGDQTRIYAGHDYVAYAMKVAWIIEPDNPDIDAYLRRYNPAQVVSTLAWERRVNPCLRFNTPGLITAMQKEGLPHATEYQRWTSVMQLG